MSSDGDLDILDDSEVETLRAQVTKMTADFDSQRASLMQMFVALEKELNDEKEKNALLTQRVEESTNSTTNVDLDESMRNAQEQTVLLRSVVKPMEDEIEGYKGQIDTLNQELNRLRNDCDTKREEERKVKEELRIQIKDAVAETKSLTSMIEQNESHFATLSVQLSGSDTALRKELEKLNKQLARVEWQNRQLTEDNDRLLAKHCSKMEQRLAAEALQLPDVFEKSARMVEHDEALLSAFQNLQFEYLKLHERMIESMETWEIADEKVRGETELLKEQQTILQEELNTCRENLSTELSCRMRDQQRIEQQERELSLKQDRLANLELIEPLKNKFEKENHELRCKVHALQKDLDDSEAVQKDFVKLSQSLQVELEKLRVCDGEVRFQHSDDVSECNGCKKQLSGSKKSNCRHCGRIFCSSCVSKTVQSGPNRRSFNVCAVCHTLLDKTSAPYFSTQGS